MKREKERVFLLAFLATLLSGFFVSCASSKQIAAEVSAPASKGADLGSVQEVVLPNGLRLLFIQDKSLPSISFSALISVGAVHEPGPELRGLNYVTLSMLEEGTTQKNAEQMAETLDSLGANLSSTASHDYSTLSLTGLSRFQDEMLKEFFAILSQPALQKKDFDRLKNRILADLVRKKDEPEEQARMEFDEVLFGKDTAYGQPEMGTEVAIKKMKLKDVVSFYQSLYVPSNVSLAIVGHFESEFVIKAQALLESWRPQIKGQEKKTTQQTMVGSLASPNILVKKSGLTQSQVLLAGAGISRTHVDFLKLRAANIVLGGGFASRLNQKIRDDLGLTYGIFSFFDIKAQPAGFYISTSVRNEMLDVLIRETKQVFQDFVEKGITEKELAAAKNLMIGQFPRSIETPEKLATNMLLLRFWGISDDYLKDYVNNVKNLNLNDVNEAIKRQFSKKPLYTYVLTGS